MTHWPLWLRILNKRLVQVQERVFRNQRVLGHPFYLTLESGNSCNLRCPLCPTTFRENSLPKGMLSVQNAVSIIDQFPALLVLSLSLWGEPFLNKQIFSVIRYARQKKIRVSIQSNFSLPQFDKDMAQALLDSDLTDLSLSIDGASQETYDVYRRKGDFALVMRNLELLARMKNEQGRKHPVITWKMVVNKFNEHEIEIAKSIADRLGLDFVVVGIYVPDHMKADWQPSRSLKLTGMRTHTDRMSRCYQLWQVMTVNFNGDVFPCCSEWSPQDALGNVLRGRVSSIWNSAGYRERRANNKSGPPACSKCHTDKTTNYWQSWNPREKTDKNPLMLPMLNRPHSWDGVDAASKGLDVSAP